MRTYCESMSVRSSSSRSCSGADLEDQHALAPLLGRAEAVDARHARDDDDVAPREERARRAEPETRDVVVLRGVLLDVEIGLRDVRLGLVVVVVGDEVLDGVLREELAELVAELRGERLVVRDHERRALELLHHPGHRRRLARARRAEERLAAVPLAQRLGELRDRLRLVAGRAVRGCHAEIGHRPPSVATGRTRVPRRSCDPGRDGPVPDIAVRRDVRDAPLVGTPVAGTVSAPHQVAPPWRRGGFRRWSRRPRARASRSPALAPSGRQRRTAARRPTAPVPILMYHVIDEPPAVGAVSRICTSREPSSTRRCDGSRGGVRGSDARARLRRMARPCDAAAAADRPVVRRRLPEPRHGRAADPRRHGVGPGS